MDSTYKSKQYRLSLLEKCCDLMKSPDISPEVIVIDHEYTLMNDVETIFPQSISLLW